MTNAPDTRRPEGVTLNAVQIWLSGLLNLIGGIILVVTRDNVDVERQLQTNSDTLLALGIVSIVIGLIILSVAGGIRRGSGFARALVSLLLVLEIASAVYVIVKIPGHNTTSFVTGGIAVVALLLLWGPRANRFFASR
jgi:hypothetical protein